MSKESEQTIGCALTIFSLVCTTPMWFVMLFMLIQATGQPTWVWVLYWVYVPVQLAAGMVGGIARVLMD